MNLQSAVGVAGQAFPLARGQVRAELPVEAREPHGFTRCAQRGRAPTRVFELRRPLVRFARREFLHRNAVLLEPGQAVQARRKSALEAGEAQQIESLLPPHAEVSYTQCRGCVRAKSRFVGRFRFGTG